MYNTKNIVFLSLDKTQKSALCNFLRALVKKSPNLSLEEIFNKFIEDETYYLEINNPHFEFLQDILLTSSFQEDVRKYLHACKKYYDYKKSQQPLIEKQKTFEKEKRKFLQEVKMKHENATKKQLYYYERLCKKYNIEMKETSTLSKYDLKTIISEIIDEHS